MGVEVGGGKRQRPAFFLFFFFWTQPITIFPYGCNVADALTKRRQLEVGGAHERFRAGWGPREGALEGV